MRRVRYRRCVDRLSRGPAGKVVVLSEDDARARGADLSPPAIVEPHIVHRRASREGLRRRDHLFDPETRADRRGADEVVVSSRRRADSRRLPVVPCVVGVAAGGILWNGGRGLSRADIAFLHDVADMLDGVGC